MPGFPKTYYFKAVEEEISAFWEREKIAESTIQFNEARPLYSFLEGPPTANAPPALHHVQSRLYKDLVCRYKFMNGFSVPRKGGWDCHGLPVEVQVEKLIGLKTKKDVIDYGIGKFNDLCRKNVFSFIEDWDRLTRRMAFWIDLENPYVTLKNEYVESVWWSLKELYGKGLLYEDHKVVPYCPRCETPLSSHEVALGYKEVTEDSVTTKFKLEGEDRYLLAWTTTPWTCPSNIALAVGKDIIYAVVEENGVQYVLAKDAVSRYFSSPVILQEMRGEELAGRNYIPLFDYFKGKLDKPAWRVILADYVNTEDGTGIVHQAPAFGEEDYVTIKKEGLAFIQPVDESGKFTKEVPDFEGRFVKEADADVIAKLDRDGKLFRKEKYAHSYPFCWRCSTPLLYYALKSWFIRVTAYKEQLIENNQKITWYPEHVRDGRFGDWLSNVKDWALSRNKFWGTPLPIWECESCGKNTAIGSVEELEAASGMELKDLDLHRPAVDKIQVNCVCRGKMTRVPYVIDAWYDSGAASFAQMHYPFENQDLFKKLYPYSFITEGIDQTRGWFYTLHVLGTLLFGSGAYKSVVVSGLIVDEKGEKMSKSKGNVFNPFEVFDQVGVDAVRLQLCSVSPDSAKRFGYELIREHVTPFLTTLWNVAVFFNGLLGSKTEDLSNLRIEDKWIISRANSLVKKFTEELQANNYHRCFEEIKSFTVEDLSRWYVRIVRDRDDDAVRYALTSVMRILVKLLAPLTPYASEYVYLNLLKEREKSVHLTKWPEAEQSDAELEKKMDVAREISQSVLSVREKMQRTLRWPVKEVFVVSSDDMARKAIEDLSGLIMTQANVKRISFQSEFKDARTILKPDYGKLGPAFGEDTPRIIARLSMTSHDAILQKLNSEGFYNLDVSGKKVRLEKDHLILETLLPEKYDSAPFSLGALYVDRDVTPEMEVEGFTREVARLIQQSRKEKGLQKTDVVGVVIKVNAQSVQKLQGLQALKSRVGAETLEVSDTTPGNAVLVKSHEIKGTKVEIFFLK